MGRRLRRKLCNGNKADMKPELNEIVVLKQNLKDLQEQLQESYKRVDELIKEIHELKRMAEEQR